MVKCSWSGTLNNGYGAAVFKPDGTLIETNMDDIEIVASKKHLQSCMLFIFNYYIRIL